MNRRSIFARKVINRQPMPGNGTERGAGGIFKKIPTVAFLSLFLAMVSAVWGITQSFISYRITENHQLISAHAESTEQHMPMERKIQLFVLRQEYEKDIREIKADLKAILKKIETMGEKK